MQNDLISRDYSVKALREYAEQKHAVGQTELANGILKAVCFLEKKENIPTAYDVEKVCEKLGGKSFDVNVQYTPIGKSYPTSVISLETAVEIVRNGGKE